MTVGQATDVGAVRGRNEDAIHTEPLDAPEVSAHGWLAIVADGLGGHQRGDLASQLAVRTTRDVYYAPSGFAAGAATGDRLRLAVQRANAAIRLAADASVSTAEMASTITAAVVDGMQLTIAQVGDSRGYLIRNARLRQITRDHSLVEELVRHGGLTPEQAVHHPQRNMVTRALGAQPTVQVDIFHEELRDEDVVLLCSDGLYRFVDESEMARWLVSEPQVAADELIALTLQRGAPDNVSVIIARISCSPTGSPPGEQ